MLKIDGVWLICPPSHLHFNSLADALELGIVAQDNSARMQANFNSSGKIPFDRILLLIYTAIKLLSYNRDNNCHYHVTCKNKFYYSCFFTDFQHIVFHLIAM